MKKSLFRLLAVFSLISVFGTGCARIYFHNGSDSEDRAGGEETSTWKHSLVDLVELGSPVNISEACGSSTAWSEVYTRKSFLNGIVTGLTFYIYTPWQADVTCAPTAHKKSEDSDS